MKKYLLLVSFVITITALYSLPILTNVKVMEFPEEIKVSYKILQFDEQIRIDVNIFNPKTKSIIKVLPDRIKCDFGKIEQNPKGTYCFAIPKKELPSEFFISDYIIMPKMILNGKIHYEMEQFKSTSKYIYFISKFETSNEQFAGFVDDDGYEIEDYWIISGGIMPKSSIGWQYQAKYNILAPNDWDLSKQPYWIDSYSNFIYGPVTSICWFEAYAYTNWCECELPTYKQVKKLPKRKI